MGSIAIAGGVAIAIVLVTRGSLRQLRRLPIRSIWMVVIAFGIQIVLELVEIPNDRIDDLGFGLLMASYGLLLAFCFVNLRVPAMWIIALGVTLNTVVIGLNQGMPTLDRDVTTSSGRTITAPIERSVTNRPESDDDLLPFLGDKLATPEPIRRTISIGDIVLALGIVAVCYQGSRRRLIAPSRTRPRRPPSHPPSAPRRDQRGRRDDEELPRIAPPRLRPRHTLSRETAGDPLGDEIEQAYARLSGEDRRRELTPDEADADEPEDR